MALSQVQCLDEYHVNPRTHESKPEFLYCEDQRLALEAFLRDGREAFGKYLCAHGQRGFLSDPELETLAESAEPYDPGSELFFPENAEEDEPPLSLHYWPELSDTSVPQMDLSWPDNVSYRGVTRTTVYAQPPLEGQVHIKEVVRKMIAQAQKVIAVVMDVFTDVDIFRDLLDAGFKRKVSVYILLERTTLPHFQSMCQRANMHAGHLKNLRVRCTDGADFYSRSCTKVRGRMGHRFMFIDGDKAVSGSYSFTWMSSRLDKNLITVVTGQAVEAFDRLFRILYATSGSVDLRQFTTETEPELEPLPQPVPAAVTSAAVARRLYSPKYAMLALSSPSPALSADPKETQNPLDSKNHETKKGRRSKEPVQEDPPIYPGLTNLEKVCMMSYLPTWPEPDPASDVIGFINIRDHKKTNQNHLQRSERFETSQAIRFSSPFSMPKETLPEVAKLRQVPAKHGATNKLQPAREETKAVAVVGGAQPAQLNAVPVKTSKAAATGQKPPASGPKRDSDPTETLNAENKRRSNAPADQDAGAPRQPGGEARPPSPGTPPLPGSNAEREAVARLADALKADALRAEALKAEALRADALKADALRAEALKAEALKADAMRADTLRAEALKADALRAEAMRAEALKAEALKAEALKADAMRADTLRAEALKAEAEPPCADSRSQAVHAQPRNSCEMTPSARSPTANNTSSPSTSVSSLSESSHVLAPTSSTTISASSPSSSSSIPPLSSSSTTPNPPLKPSSASPSSTPTTPVPKPRTVQLVIKGQKLPEFSVLRKPESSTGVLDERASAAAVKTSPEENVPGTARKDADGTMEVGEAAQQKRSVTSRETKTEAADGRHERAATRLAAGNEAESDASIADAPKAASVNIQEIIPTDVEPKTLMSTDCKLTPQMELVAAVRTETKAPGRDSAGCESPAVPSEKRESVSECKTYHARAHVPQRISYSELTPKDARASEMGDSTKAPVSSSHAPKHGADARGRPSCTPNAAKHNAHDASQEQIPKAEASTRTPERPQSLHLSDAHVPDFGSPTPERESRLLWALTRTPTPDGFLPRTPTPDSRPNTPDLRTPDLRTPDFQTPTPDGYISARTDSALSANSEEYYECRDSPFHEPVFDRASFRNPGATEDHVGFTHADAPNATSIACAATLGTKDSRSSGSETESLSGSESVSSLSSLKGKTAEENVENGGEEDERGIVGEGYRPGTERRGSDDAKRRADHFQRGEGSTGAGEENKEGQAPKKKRVLSQSAAEKPAPGESTNERTGPKGSSTGDRQRGKSSSERKRPNKEKAVELAALGPSGAERRDTDRQKLLHTLPKTLRGQQRDGEAPSPSRPFRPPRPLSISWALGPRPCGGRRPDRAESEAALPGGFRSADGSPSPRGPPSGPPSPDGRRGLVSRQPPAARGGARAGPPQSQRPFSKPEASQSQTEEEHRQEEGKSPFSLTFSRLYSLKGLKDLKDKVSKLPAQSGGRRASSPAPGRKSTS